MSDNKVTLDQLDNSAIEAMSSSVGDVSMLNTENKTIVGALAEIVGKKEIANAIGEPLAETDKFTEMSSEINGLLSTFKTNMMNAGVVVESGDKFKALIDKIATMAEEGGNKGMKFASGTCNISLPATASAVNADIPYNLDFTPTYVFLNCSSVGGNYIGYGCANMIVSNIINNATITGDYSSKATFTVRNITNEKCNLNISLTNSTSENTTILATVNRWYAIGVGEEDTTLRDSLASILQGEGVTVTEEDDMASLISKVDQEFDRQVVPAGDATVEDVIAGKTFMNNMGELLTGALVSGLNKIKQGSLKTDTLAGKTLDVSVTNIGFKPSIVIIYCGGASSICIAIQDELFSSFPLNGYMFTPTYSIGAGYLNALGTSSGDDYYILNNRFKLKIPVHDVSSATVSWIAMGR